MSAQVMYRIATVDDVEQLVHLRTLMQCELNNLDPLKDFVEFKKATRAYFLESIKNGSYACGVAEISGLIVSTSGVIFYQKPPSILSNKGTIGYVTNVYTLKGDRGKGHATNTLKLIIEESKRRKADKLTLGATDDGLTVYQNLGFKSIPVPSLELKL